MQNFELDNYRNELYQKLNSEINLFNFTNKKLISDITKNDFLEKLSFLENQIFNLKTKNLINNFQTWILIYLKKLFYDAVKQNFKYLQKDYKKFILKIYDFFELDKNKNTLTYEMYNQFENSLNNQNLFENAKNFSENYYSKISWEKFLFLSIQDSEYNQKYFENCYLPWNIEILKQTNSNNEFVLNIYADNEILLNLADLVLNKILIQDIFYKLTFQVNFYNSREKDFDYKKILNGNESIINIITSKYELLILNLIEKQKLEFLNFLNVDEIFNCIEKNSMGFDPMIQSLFEIHYQAIVDYYKNNLSFEINYPEIVKHYSENSPNKFDEFIKQKIIPTKIKMLYIKKPNLTDKEFINNYKSANLIIFTDKPISKSCFQVVNLYNNSDGFSEKIKCLFGDYHLNRILLNDFNNYDWDNFFKLKYQTNKNAEKNIQNDFMNSMISIYSNQMDLLNFLTSDDYEICGIYSNDF